MSGEPSDAIAGEQQPKENKEPDTNTTGSQFKAPRDLASPGATEELESSSEDLESGTSAKPVKRRWRPGQGFYNWATALIALIALLISADSWIKLNSKPDVSVQLSPRLDTLYKGQEAHVNVGPAFQVLNRTDRLVIISNAQLELRKRGVSERRSLTWSQLGDWGKVGEDVYFMYKSLPAPILIAADTVQSPVLKFIAMNWKFTPGVWDGTVTFHREDGASLSESFCLKIEPSDIQWMEHGENQNTPRRYRNDSLAISSEPLDCYRYSPVQ